MADTRRTGSTSSRHGTCATCGRIDGPKPLSARSCVCPCGAVHDRDVNAAVNILAQGRWERLNACGAALDDGRN
uniref:zinc ribbon domain-containing protein n=1 Tax=Micromonospora purpureochromogenes TaxID=47872 RepID=UPI00358DAD48